MEGNMVTQILANLGINYQPAIRAGQEFARSLEPVNVQLERLQKNFRAAGIFAGDLASSLNREKIILDQYGRELVRVQEQTVRKLNAQVKKQFKQAEKEARSFYKNLSEMSAQLERRFGWFAAGLGFYGAQDVFRQILTTMGNVEMGMIELARIQDDVNFNFNEMRQALFDLGKEYGQTWEVVQDIALRWSQAGLDMKDTLEATRASLLALNTAELDAQQSTVGLVGIMSQWNLEASQLLDVIDKINITADNFVVTSQDLVDGLLRSSGSARVLGLSLEETIAVLTAMREASGRTGREVGNALNSILSFMQRDKAISTFERLGINIWADETKTQFRNVLEIFEQVAARWDEISDDIKDGFVEAASEAGLFNEDFAVAVGLQEQWNDLQKRDVSQAMAGIYRRNYLLALLQNWATVQEVLNNLTRAHGYSLRENERTMEAYQKKVDSLRMALTELAVAVGEAGLLDIMKGLVDGTKEAVQFFRDLPEPIQDAIIVLTGLTAALMGVNLTFRVFLGMGIGGMLIRLAAQIAAVEAATLSLGAALRILATNPVTLLITALGTLTGAVIAYKNYQEQAVQRISNSIEQHRREARAAKEKADRINELVDQYKKLEGQSDKTAAQQDRLKQIEEELVDLLPELKTGYDEAGNAVYDMGNLHEVAAAKVRKLTNEMKEQIRIAAKVAKTQLPELKRAKEKAAKKKIRAEEALDRLEEGDFLGAVHELNELDPWGLHLFPTREKVARDLGKILDEAAKEYTKANEAYKKAQEAIKAWNAVQANRMPALEGFLATRKPSGGGTARKGSVTSSPVSRDKTSSGVSGTTDPLDFLESYERQLQLTSLALQRLGIQEQLINQTISDQYPTVEQARAAYFNWAQQINTLRQQQEQLKEESRAIAAQIAKTGDVTGELTRKFNENKNAILESEYQIGALQQKMKDFEQQMRDMRFNQTMDYFQHQVNMARLTVAQQIEYLRTVSNEFELSAARRWQIEENLFNLYRRRLNEQMDDIREAYQERLKLIEEETNAEIAAIQKRLDALDERKELEDREEARRQHEEKIQELLKEKRYHELRTGKEHEEALADIKKQIAEENRRWEQRQREWQREDEKRNLQKQIDDIREAASKKKAELEDYYNEALEIMNDATQDMLASLAATDEQWYERGIAWAQKLAQGLRDGSFTAIDSIIDEVRAGVGEAEGEFERRRIEERFGTPPDLGQVIKQPVAVISRGQYDMVGNTAVMYSRALGNILNKSVSWDQTTGRVIIGGKSFTPLKNEDGKTYVSIRQVAEALGFDVDCDNTSKSISIWPKAHWGAFVKKSGFAELLEGERVLSPKVTASFDKLANVLANFSNIPDRIAVMMRGGCLNDLAVDRIINAIEKRMGFNFEKLVNIENFNASDQVDIEIFSRELGRMINTIS